MRQPFHQSDEICGVSTGSGGSLRPSHGGVGGVSTGSGGLLRPSHGGVGDVCFRIRFSVQKIHNLSNSDYGANGYCISCYLSVSLDVSWRYHRYQW
jgi:hypothetical protein